MKRTKHILSTLSLLAVLALLIAACGPTVDTAATEAAMHMAETEAAMPKVTEIKIAFFGPLTGDAASIGQEQLLFARLAVADFNKSMGAQFNATLVEEDTDISPDKALPVCQKTAEDATVLGVVGPAGSGQVEACGQILTDAGLAFVSSSATRPSLSAAGFHFFRVVPNDDVQGPTVGNYIADEIGAKNVYVMDDQSSYGVTLADTVQATLDGKGVTTARSSVTQDDNDFSALVTTIIGADAEVVFFAGQIASQGALLARQLAEQGADIPVFGGDGFFSVKDFITDAGGATEGSFASIFAPDIRGIAEAADVVAAADASGTGWGNFGPPTYVAVKVVLEAAAHAAEAGNLSRAGVLEQVKTTQMPSSILGIPISFDANGEVVGAAFFISKVEGPTFVQVYP